MSNFGGYAISESLYNSIKELLEEGSTILELGSGTGTIELCKHYKVYSVEHNKDWLNKSSSNYIYAPLKNNWYSLEMFKSIPNEYDLLLIDGPPGGSRQHMINHLNKFNLNTNIIVDDVNRRIDLKLANAIKDKTNRDYKIVNDKEKSFAIFKK